MNKYYIPHKLKVGDITHLSDNDSEMIIKERNLLEEDIVEIETYEKIYLGQITYIDKATVEIEIIEEKGEREILPPSITLIQSISNDSKFNYFLEKSVEIGIGRIIPIQSEYSLKSVTKARKDMGLWSKIVKDATEQSRNPNPTIIEKPIKISDLQPFLNTTNICLATENVNTKSLKEVDLTKNVVLAIGPEKGWSSTDIGKFKELNFEFVQLKGNILRTETTGLVIGSIIKYIKGEI